MSKIVRTIFAIFKVSIVLSSDLLDLILYFVTAVTTSRVMSHECSKVHKALAGKICMKKDERYNTIMRYLLVKLNLAQPKR